MQEPGNLQVVAMGMVTVFACLVILIAVIMIMGKIMQSFSKNEKNIKEQISVVSSNSNTLTPQIISAIGVAIAEELGTDVSKIKVHSIAPLK